MDSAFLVFDLIAGNAGLEVKGDTRNLIDQERDHRKKAVALIVREKSESSAGSYFSCRDPLFRGGSAQRASSRPSEGS